MTDRRRLPAADPAAIQAIMSAPNPMLPSKPDDALRADLHRVTVLANDRKAELDRAYRKIDRLTHELSVEREAHAGTRAELDPQRRWWWR